MLFDLVSENDEQIGFREEILVSQFILGPIRFGKPFRRPCRFVYSEKKRPWRVQNSMRMHDIAGKINLKPCIMGVFPVPFWAIGICLVLMGIGIKSRISVGMLIRMRIKLLLVEVDEIVQKGCEVEIDELKVDGMAMIQPPREAYSSEVCCVSDVSQKFHEVCDGPFILHG